MTNLNAEQMRRMVDFFNTGDLSTLASVVATDYVDHQGVGQGPLLGADGFAGVVQLSRERHPELSVDISELHVVGDVVITKLIWSAKAYGTANVRTSRSTLGASLRGSIAGRSHASEVTTIQYPASALPGA